MEKYSIKDGKTVDEYLEAAWEESTKKADEMTQEDIRRKK